MSSFVQLGGSMTTRTHLLTGAIALGANMQARLLKTYSLVFVGLFALGNSAFAQAPANLDWPEPIALKCPVGPNGVYEEIRIDRKKIIYRVRITLINGAPTILLTASKGLDQAEFVPEHLTDLRTEPDKGERIYADAVIRRHKVAIDICRGSKENREKYFATLAANRARWPAPGLDRKSVV